MLDFSKGDEKAKLVMIHYAEKLNNEFISNLINQSWDIKSSEEACELASFFWQMLEASAGDEEAGITVLGESSLQFWMERLLNILSGYLEKMGYEKEWERISDEA